MVVADASNITIQSMNRINQDHGSAQATYFEKQAAYNTIVGANPETVVKSDPLVQQLAGEQSLLEREYAQKLSTFLPQHPHQNLRKHLAIHILAGLDPVERSRRDFHRLGGITNR
jgi:hypothetical protein